MVEGPLKVCVPSRRIEGPFEVRTPFRALCQRCWAHQLSKQIPTV
jgi:hypothetical protein